MARFQFQFGNLKVLWPLKNDSPSLLPVSSFAKWELEWELPHGVVLRIQ